MSDSDSYSNSSISSSDIEEQDDLDLQGSIINKKYVILDKLGAGASATVWMAYHIHKNMFYAIKVQNSEDFDDGVDEVKLLKKINKVSCKYLTRLIDDFIYDSEFGEHVCMVFNLKACSLDDIINVKDSKYSYGLPFEVATEIIRQLLVALNELHTKCNIMHTDIKPENILINGVNHKTKILFKHSLIKD